MQYHTGCVALDGKTLGAPFIKHLTNLKGLEAYSGPTNIRVENKFVGSVKLIWDLSETSCYRQADTNVTLYTSDDTERVVVIYNEATSVDLLGLQQDQVYSVSLNFGYRRTQFDALPYTFKTVGPFIVCEYCTNGQMRDYLETMKDNITVETLERQLRFGLGVARGMDFLAQRKVVHRRLAARNVLLDADLNPKITGFEPKAGETHDGDSNKRERIPLKWMAPECLKSTLDATEKSDVWSFGVVLWEIFSFGESPYGNIRGHELPAKLKEGYRLPKPEQCDYKWYDVMKQTWEESPEKRPTFKEIRSTLDEIFVAAPSDDYYYYRK